MMGTRVVCALLLLARLAAADLLLAYSIERHGARNVLPKTATLKARGQLDLAAAAGAATSLRPLRRLGRAAGPPPVEPFASSCPVQESDAAGGPTLLPEGQLQAWKAGAAYAARYLNASTCSADSTCLDTKAAANLPGAPCWRSCCVAGQACVPTNAGPALCVVSALPAAGRCSCVALQAVK